MNIILIKEDKSCEMACVLLNNKCIMEGNYWDFYSGCHGIYEWGEFNSLDELIKNIQSALLSRGEKVKIENKEYKYV